MRLSTLIFLIGGSAAGVYLQSKEGEQSRKKLKESLDNIKPVLKDMLLKLDEVISDSKSIKSDEIRINIERKVDRLKKAITKLDSEKIASVTDQAVRDAAKKLRHLREEIASEPVSSTKAISKKKVAKK